MHSHGSSVCILYTEPKYLAKFREMTFSSSSNMLVTLGINLTQQFVKYAFSVPPTI
jgi:hypothetical protein